MMENEDLTTINPGEEEEINPIDALIESAEGRDVVNPEVLGPAQYAAPFRSQIGNSTVDLAVPENQETMKSEYDEWWNFGKKRGFLGVPYTSDEFKGERDKLKDKWYQKYHGMSLEEFNAAREEATKKTGGFYPGANDIAGNMKNTFQGLSVPGLSLIHI